MIKFRKNLLFLTLLSIFFIPYWINAASSGNLSGGPACGNTSNNNTPSVTTYTIGGSVSDLNGTLVLQNNGEDTLSLSSNGNFTFSKALENGSSYNVSIFSQPSGQTCSVSNASGTVNAANVNNVSITCDSASKSNFTIGGTVSGLANGANLTIQNGSNSDSLTISSNGSFTFNNTVTQNEGYAVGITTWPLDQACSVSNETGHPNADVSNITIACSDAIILYSLGGSSGGGARGNTRGDLNSQCSTAAGNEGLTCTAALSVISFSSSDNINNMQVNYSIPSPAIVMNKYGITLKDSWENLINNGPDVSMDAAGITSDPYWIGGLSPNDAHNQTCMEWSSSLNVDSGIVGDPTSTSTTFINNSSNSCDTLNNMLCICYLPGPI